MSTEAQHPAKTRNGAVRAVRGASWMSLVAATTLGLGAVDELRTHVRADDLGGEGDAYRLIVQAYSRDSLSGELPSRYARPSASTQRAVTAEELQNGIDVRLVQLDSVTTDAVVVAWVERGEPDLEFDARRARPQEDSYYGIATDDEAHIVLKRPASRVLVDS